MFEFVPQAELEQHLHEHSDLRRLYYRHREIDKKIESAEHGTLGLTDEHMTELKRERLHLKENIQKLWPEGLSRSVN
jgi:uncharacterized protein YdcH (DUF465 family)